MSDQADARCPRCSALLRSGAQWCTLCYADLRPTPEPEPVAVGARAEPVSALQEAALAVAGGTGSAPEVDPSVAPVGWPCTGCQAVVSFDEDACPDCGTRFLDGARGAPDLLDRIGPGGLPVSTQTLIIAGGAVAIIAIITAVLYVIGLLI